jgi:hypothetical protein
LRINAIQFVGIDHGVAHISDLEVAFDLPRDRALTHTGGSTDHENVHRGEITAINGFSNDLPEWTSLSRDLTAFRDRLMAIVQLLENGEQVVEVRWVKLNAPRA